MRGDSRNNVIQMTGGCGIGATPDIWMDHENTKAALTFRQQALPSGGILAAGAGVLAEYLLAFLARYRPVSDDLGKQIVGDDLGLAFAQRCAWGKGGSLRTELRRGHAVAAVVGIGLLVEVRHRCSRPAAHDHLDQLVAVEEAVAQVGGAAIRLRLAGAVGSPAVAERALRLVLIESARIGKIIGYRYCWTSSRCEHERAEGARNAPDMRRNEMAHDLRSSVVTYSR